MRTIRFYLLFTIRQLFKTVKQRICKLSKLIRPGEPGRLRDWLAHFRKTLSSPELLLTCIRRHFRLDVKLLIILYHRLTRKKAGKRLIQALALCSGLYLVLMLVVVCQPLSRQAILTGYEESYRLYDRNGNLLREVVNAEGAKAQWLAWPALCPYMADATVAVEDKYFYSHQGIDLTAAVRALFQNTVKQETFSGASTISMQLARLIFHHSHSLLGKLGQIYDALRLEETFSKEELLLQYMNRAFYGAGSVGVEAASWRFFNKPNGHLSLAEAAFLAGLPQAPSYYNPFENFAGARGRQKYVLACMLATGKIDRKQYQAALTEELKIRDHQQPISAMHFTDYVLSQKPAYGDVFTTLDKELNAQIETLVKEHVSILQSAGLTNAAVVVLDNHTGEILAMVGSKDYWDGKAGSVNGATALRQPGSTLKPFTYACAFESRHTPATVVPDVEINYVGGDDRLYIPQNFTGKYSGPVLLKEALARSLNVPAIRVANAVGVKVLLEKLHAAGIASLTKDADFYGLGLTLGDGEVSLLELAQAFALFTRAGMSCPARAFKNQQLQTPVQVFSNDVCFLISDILSDQTLRIQALGPSNPLLFPFPIAIKTGTSNNWRDNWVIGFTKDHTVAVWAGNFEGNPMNQLSGSIGAGPLFSKIIRLVLDYSPYPQGPIYDTPPETVKNIVVCKFSGQLPTELCDHLTSLYIIKNKAPELYCSVHKQINIDKRNGLLASPKCPKKFLLKKTFLDLPPVYSGWMEEQGLERVPAAYSEFAPLTGPAKNSLVITQPYDGDVYIIEPGYNRNTQTLEFSGESDPATPYICWLLDGKELAKADWPYKVNWPLQKGKHHVQMQYKERLSDAVTFEVK